ncbi:MAG: DUF4097 family beta strand repeat-containing protein [Dokdonella sp.]
MRLLPASILLLLASPVLADLCEHRAERNLDIDVAGLRGLVIELGADDLALRGVAGLKRIEVRGIACASDPERLARLQLAERRDGDRVVVRAERESTSSWSLFGSTYGSLDLEVRIPAELALEIDAGSGDSVISDVAALNYKAGSGDLELRNVAGDVRAHVGSGDIEAFDVGAFTLVSTGSGDIGVDGVRSDVIAESAGSGDMKYSRVGGTVRIGDVGSGDVTVTGIGGDVIVASIGSGDVSVDEVRGNLSVRAQGSGYTTQRNVRGKVDVPDKG